METHKKLVIGLFGFGTVGEGLYKILQQTPSLQASIKKICIKHPEKKRNAPAELFTTNRDLLLNDPQINVIVEVIDDADAAFRIVTKALHNNKDVVSSSKKMIAEHLHKKRELALSLLYKIFFVKNVIFTLLVLTRLLVAVQHQQLQNL